MCSVQIRPLSTVADFDSVVDLQRNTWGYSDLESEGRAILTVASRFAGQLLGAFKDSQMVGFALAFVGREPESLHSHRVGVLPSYQNAGIGRALKLAQRELALKQGYRFIRWTFDPMQIRNAYFNLRRLGGHARYFAPNLYGTTGSPLHGGLPTDRLLLDWDLLSRRVVSAISGSNVIEARHFIRIPILADHRSTPAVNQQRLRERLQEAFASGLIVTDFDIENNYGFYILETP